MSYIGVPPFGQTVRTITELTAAAGQTTFNISGGYLPGYIDVFLNGSSLGAADFTASNGSTVVLNVAAALNDEFKALAYWPVSLVDTYRKSEADARYLSSTNGSVTQAKLAAGVAGNGPAFSAYSDGGQAITANVNTKIQLGGEIFDTASNYNTSTYRFTPSVAGYYAINLHVGIANTSTGYYCDVTLQKNGSVLPGNPICGGGGNGTSWYRGAASTVVYANGTTDYFEVYAQSNVSQTTATCGFSGALIRSAT